MSFPKVLGARAIIKPKRPEEETPSGIIIATDHQEPKYEGRVMAVGPGARTEKGVQMPMEVQVGDYVVYTRMAGAPIEHEGEEYLVINERDIICIVPEKE